MLKNLGGFEAILIAAMVLLLVGGKKIPELGRGLGEALREFKRGIRQEKEEDTKETTEEPKED